MQFSVCPRVGFEVQHCLVTTLLTQNLHRSVLKWIEKGNKVEFN
jgi:hypothetical protein